MKFKLKRFIFLIAGLLLLSCSKDDDIDPTQTADLSIAIETNTDTPTIGTELVFTVIVTNNGPLDATDLIVKDKILSGYTFVSFIATSGDYDAETGIWTIGNLNNQGHAIIYIHVIVNPTGDYNNTASVSGGQNDLSETNNNASIVIDPTQLTGDMLFTYTISEGDDKFVTITGLSEVWEDLSGTYKSDITVPGEIQGYPVKVIDLRAFEYNNDLIKVTFSNGVTSIGNRVFFYCENLESVILPNSITSLGMQVFYKCSSLKTVSLPDKITIIEDAMFDGCLNLTDIVIPDSVVEIDRSAFGDCTSLTNIIIPKNVRGITDSSFRGCSALNSLTVAESNQFFSADENVLYDKNKNKLIYCLQTKSGSFTIPNSVTEIDRFAFEDCVNLTNIGIPDSVVSVGWYSITNCSGLTEITIPESVKEIDGAGFGYNFNLKTVIVNAIVPPSVQPSFLPFQSCTSLTTIKVPAQSVEAYKTASGWSAYTSIIVAQ